MNLRRILNALSEQTDPIMDIPGETFTSGPFEGQPKVAGKLDILRDNEPYVGEVDGDDKGVSPPCRPRGGPLPCVVERIIRKVQ